MGAVTLDNSHVWLDGRALYCTKNVKRAGAVVAWAYSACGHTDKAVGDCRGQVKCHVSKHMTWPHFINGLTKEPRTRAASISARRYRYTIT